MSVVATPLRRRSGPRAELLKLGAFFRRDFLNAWSYRLSFASELMSLSVGVIMFYLVSRMVDPTLMPTFGGIRLTYMEFVATGVIIGVLVQIGVHRVTNAIEGEQVKGTLESLLMTPTRTPTLLIGSSVYDVVFVPIRAAVTLGMIALVFGLRYDFWGAPAAAVFLLAFMPFVWGVGMISAALKLTFRQGSGAFAVFVTLLTVGSGAYIPIGLLPEPAPTVAPYNPIAIVANGLRESLVVGDWSAVDQRLLTLPGLSLVALGFGVLALRLAMRRERRQGTIGIY